MSVLLMSMAFKSPLPTSEKMVMLVMCDFANDEGNSCFPAVETIAEKASMSPRNVHRILKKLKDDGWIAPEQDIKGGKGKTVPYQINLDGLRNPDKLSVFQDAPNPDTGVTQTLTDATSNPDTGVIQYTNNHQVTISGSSEVGVSGESAGDGEDDSPPPVKNNLGDAGCQMQSIIREYFRLEQSMLDANPARQRITDDMVELVAEWLDAGITADFMRKTWKYALSELKRKGRSAPHFSYWKPIMPDRWHKSDDAKKVALAKRREPFVFDPAKTNPKLNHPSLANHPSIPSSNRAAWARHQMMALRDDERWSQLCELFRKRYGRAIHDAWLEKCAPVLIEPDRFMLWCPSSYHQTHLRDCYKHDLQKMVASVCGNACVLELVV